MQSKSKYRQCNLCEQLQSADLQNIELRLIISKLFSAKKTTRHDLDNIFTKNVKNVTQYVNGVTNVNLVTLKKVLPD